MRSRAPLLVAGALAACAGRPAPNPELEGARIEVASVETRAMRERVPYAVDQAAAALAAAERAEKVDPTALETSDSAYVARRLAERARILAVYAADLDARDSADASARRIRTNIERQRNLREDRLRREKLAEQERVAQRETLSSALERARGPAELLDEGEVLTLRYQPASLFRFLRPRMLPGFANTLRPVVNALRSGLPVEVSIIVTQHESGLGADAAMLGNKRADELRAALLTLGVPFDVLVSAHGQQGEHSYVSIVVSEKPITVPPLFQSDGLVSDAADREVP